jgi:hypothetical protein
MEIRKEKNYEAGEMTVMPEQKSGLHKKILKEEQSQLTHLPGNNISIDSGGIMQ